MAVLAIFNPGFVGSVASELEALSGFLSGEDVIVVGRSDCADVMPHRFEYIECDLMDVDAIDHLVFSSVILVGYSRQDTLPAKLFSLLIAKNIDSIRVFVDGVLARYRPFQMRKSRVLLVFPGAILPLGMGSHQRAFNLLVALAYSGYYADVIVTGGDVSKAARLLEGICPNVYIYKNNKRKLPRFLALRRGVERKLREFSGMSNVVPELYVDRLSNKATYSLQKTLARVLEASPHYKAVIVSYAWMARCSKLVSAATKRRLKWICDTHDVQYIRNASASNAEKRFLALAGLDKRAELRTLSGFDSMLAISKSDADELKKEFGRKVLQVGSSFEYAYADVRKRDEKKPLNFGFIGGRMDANVKALEYILDCWWPIVRSYSPASKLYLAGTVTKVDSIVERIAFEETIEDLGFVDSLSDFYKKFDVSLNPVLVQGGLNFKSVEAVFAGKLLITNGMGIKCLGEADIADVVDEGSMLDPVLRKYELDPVMFRNILIARQRMARAYFGDESAYSALLEYLNEVC